MFFFVVVVVVVVVFHMLYHISKKQSEIKEEIRYKEFLP